jgi:drug/metabolite transporter (DMT)-like permease
MSKPLPTTALAVTLGVVALLWGGSFVLMKTLTASFQPFTLSALRAGAAAGALALFFLATRRSLRPTPDDTRAAGVMGTLHGWIPNALVAFAVTGLGAGLAAMLQSAAPLATALIAHVVLPSERIDGRRWLGVGVGFLGVATLIGPEALSGSRASLLPVAAMGGVALSYAIGNVWVRRYAATPPERLAFGQQAFGGLFALALALLFEPREDWRAVATLWPQILVFGALGSALPFTLFMWMIQRAGPVKATMVGYLVPLVAATLATLTLGETLAPRQIVGGLVILAGVWMTTRR